MIENKEKIGVLFVCMGNICRSPTAEGVFRKLVSDAGLDDRIYTDSAGTHAYHSGEPPDHRAIAAAERRGFSLEDISARRVTDADFEDFNYILAMDEDNMLALRESSKAEHHSKVRLLLEFSEFAPETEVPDPYYGGPAGFERVLDLVEVASRALLETIRKEL
ncbi:MAG: low molecular weight phosphotyrosine protein phosphatase [Proteobacteria bacterium]|nr:low molecular weight phosphotyrosine protein phosphatase [Pseudomonadota bacterium]MDA0993876.1 low molecular weight phosphotyrosine protein phosphatase [Pseudomonadota bacterium]